MVVFARWSRQVLGINLVSIEGALCKRAGTTDTGPAGISDGASSMTNRASNGYFSISMYILILSFVASTHLSSVPISVYGSSKRGNCDILWSTCPNLQIFHGFPLFFQHVQSQMTNEGLPSRENGRNSLKSAGPRPVWNSNLFGGPDTAQYAVSDVRSMSKCWLPFIGIIGGWSYHTSSKRELLCPSWILIYSSRELYSANIKIPNISQYIIRVTAQMCILNPEFSGWCGPGAVKLVDQKCRRAHTAWGYHWRIKLLRRWRTGVRYRWYSMSYVISQI